MNSYKLGKYLYDTTILLHKTIMKKIEKESDNLELKELEYYTHLHLKLSEKIEGYIRGYKQNELFNLKSKN